MRILITALNYAPEPVGAGRYTAQIAEHLAARGHEVRVVAAPPYFPHWRVYEGYKGSRYTRESRGGVTVFRCPAWMPRRPCALARIIHDASFAASSAGRLLGLVSWRPETVLAVTPSILSAFSALAAARLAGARSVLHVQDLELKAAENLRLLPKWALKSAGRAEAWIMRRFDSVIAISREMAAAIGEACGIERVSILRNWADLTDSGPKADNSAGARFGIPDEALIVLYSGSIGRKQDIEILIRAARNLRREDILFIICGDGPGRSQLERAASDLPKVRFLPLQAEQEHRELLCRADIHVLPQRGGLAGAFMPSKLANICSCGGALVCVADLDCELAGMARAAGGRLVRPGDPEALAAAIRDLAERPGLRREMGDKARAYAGLRFDKAAALRLLEARILSAS